MATGYVNYVGATVRQGGSPTAWLNTTAKGQTLTAQAGVNTQLSDSFGASTLIGASGDDTFDIGDPSTKIVVTAGSGVDTVNAWCSFVLPANVDTLVLENAHTAGTANNDGDLIVAIGAHDSLQGGLGADVLVDGGGGSDTFWFLSKGNHETVYGFQTSGANHDILSLTNYGYTSLAQVQAHMAQVGADVLLSLSPTHTILIRNTEIGDFTAADFSFPALTAILPTVAQALTAAGAPPTMASPYLNFAGQPFMVSAGTATAQSTTAAGQTLTALAGADAVLSDLFGGGTLIGAGGDTFDVTSASTKLSVTAGTRPATVDAWCSYALPVNAHILVLEAAHLNATANSQSDLIIALGAHEVIQDGLGGDVLVDGGAGGDTFWFLSAGNDDVIYGFQTGGANADVLNLTNYHLDSLADVQSHMIQLGADVELALSATNTILIKNTTIAAFTLADFALPVDYTRMHLTFDEEFNSLSLYNASTGQGVLKSSYIFGAQGESGATAWSSRTASPTGEQELYVDPSFAGTGTTALGINPFSINNGVLTITASKTPTADLSALYGYQYTSGLLTTEKSFAQLYGYFEIRAELPTGQGVWPAFWLLPANGSNPPELDVIESIGGNAIYQTAHSVSGGTTYASAFTTDLSSVAAWHTYGVLWTAQTLSFYVDGVEVASLATPADMNTPMYMLVNLAIGGTWPGNAPASFTSAQMEIDYIRAYALNSSTAAAVASNTAYVLQSATDTAPTTANIIQSAYTHSLAGTSAHYLELTGSANINATANTLGDHLTGNAGANILTGGTGNDTLTAGTGNDVMIGGGGTDTFVFNQGAAHDVINDFSGHDVIDVSSYMNAGLTPVLTSDANGNAIISFSTGTTIELLGVHSASLIATATGFTH